MSFLAKILGTTGTGGWIVYLLIFGIIFALGGAAGSKLQQFTDAPTISQLKADVATAKGDTQAQKTALETYHAQVEAARANANLEAARQADLNAAALAKASQQLKETENARRNASQARLSALRAVPQVDTTPLSPGARAWYDSLRNEQRARTAASAVTP